MGLYTPVSGSVLMTAETVARQKQLIVIRMFCRLVHSNDILLQPIFAATLSNRHVPNCWEDYRFLAHTTESGGVATGEASQKNTLQKVENWRSCR
jgi:hypothetical protein